MIINVSKFIKDDESHTFVFFSYNEFIAWNAKGFLCIIIKEKGESLSYQLSFAHANSFDELMWVLEDEYKAAGWELFSKSFEEEKIDLIVDFSKGLIEYNPESQ